MKAIEEKVEPRSAIGSAAWKDIESHSKKIRNTHLRRLFPDDHAGVDRLLGSCQHDLGQRGLADPDRPQDGEAMPRPPHCHYVPRVRLDLLEGHLVGRVQDLEVIQGIVGIVGK
jgi:hypothetical protein